MTSSPEDTGKQKTTVLSVIRAALASGITFGAILGAAYGYGALNNRMDSTERAVASNEAKTDLVNAEMVKCVQELRQEMSEIKTTVMEVKTDTKWIVKQMK